MTRSLAALVLVSVLSAAPAHAQSPWRLVWSDEFSGDRLDLSKWTPAVDCYGGGNDERQCYVDSPDTISVRDGVLRLTALKRPTTVGARSGDYASGKLVTKGKASWRYGKVEARAKAPGGQGVWPAIWMMPEAAAYGGWPRSGEIDILETVNLGAPCEACDGGRENRVFGTIHFAADASGAHKQFGGKTPMPASPSGSGDGFHVYAVEWSPEAIAWSVDGHEYFRATAADWKRADKDVVAAPFDQPFHLILNLAFGGRWPEGANAKGIDAAAVPATMEIDWVRVSQR